MAIVVAGSCCASAEPVKVSAATAIVIATRERRLSFTAHLQQQRRHFAVWVFRQAFCRRASRRTFSRPFALSFLSRSATSFLFRASNGRRYLSGDRTERGRRSAFFARRRRRSADRDCR